MEITLLPSHQLSPMAACVQKILLLEEVEFVSISGMKTLLDFYSLEEMWNRSQDGKTIFYEFKTGSKFIGFAEMEEQHLVSLYIEKEFRKKQVGKKFIDFLVNQKSTKKEITVFSSPLSIGFYKQCGFEPQSINLVLLQGILYLPMIKKIA